MNKYIDAEKLKKILDAKYKEFTEKAKKDCPLQYQYMADGLDIAKQFVDSLQQEQPEVDLVAELKHHLATTPPEQLEKEWKELEPWGNIGPTVQEFLYGKQPEVDLEKVAESVVLKLHPIMGKCSAINLGMYEMIKLVKSGFELRLNAKKEK